MKRMLQVCPLIFGLIMSWNVVNAADYYVIPVPPVPAGEKATGDATEDDVLKGKTFSNSSGTGSIGERPPLTLLYDVRWSWPEPRFFEGTYIVRDSLTGKIWQKSMPYVRMTYSDASQYCIDLVIWEPAGNFFSVKYDNWHVPRIDEMFSLIDWNNQYPAYTDSLPFDSMHYR